MNATVKPLFPRRPFALLVGVALLLALSVLGAAPRIGTAAASPAASGEKWGPDDTTTPSANRNSAAPDTTTGGTTAGEKAGVGNEGGKKPPADPWMASIAAFEYWLGTYWSYLLVSLLALWALSALFAWVLGVGMNVRPLAAAPWGVLIAFLLWAIGMGWYTLFYIPPPMFIPWPFWTFLGTLCLFALIAMVSSGNRRSNEY